MARRLEQTVTIMLLLIILAAGFAALWLVKDTLTPLQMMILAVVWIGAGLLSIRLQLKPASATPTDHFGQPLRREPIAILRWLIIIATLLLSAFILLMGLFVQYIMTAALGIISPALHLPAFLIVGGLWTLGVGIGVVRVFRTQSPLW
jgi:hypothetical protein